jgi:hypothetical protein
MRSAPDQFAVFIHFFDAVKGNRTRLAARVSQLKGEVVPLFEMYFLKWDTDDFLLNVVEIPNFEIGFSELLIPPDSIQ